MRNKFKSLIAPCLSLSQRATSQYASVAIKYRSKLNLALPLKTVQNKVAQESWSGWVYIWWWEKVSS